MTNPFHPRGHPNLNNNVNDANEVESRCVEVQLLQSSSRPQFMQWNGTTTTAAASCQHSHINHHHIINNTQCQSIPHHHHHANNNNNHNTNYNYQYDCLPHEDSGAFAREQENDVHGCAADSSSLNPAAFSGNGPLKKRKGRRDNARIISPCNKIQCTGSQTATTAGKASSVPNNIERNDCALTIITQQQGIQCDDSSEIEKKCDAIIDHARKTISAIVNRVIEEKLPRGVCYRNGKYKARIYFRGTRRHICVFETAGEARIAYIFARTEIDQINTQKGIGDASDKEKKFIGIIQNIRKAARTTLDRARGVTLGSDGKYEARFSFHGETRLIDSYETVVEAQIAVIFAESTFDRIKNQKGFDDPLEVEMKCDGIIKNIQKVTSASIDRAIEEKLPIGVSHLSGKYRARINIHGKTRHIDLFETAGEARIAYIFARTEIDQIKTQKGFEHPSQVEKKFDDILVNIRKAARATFDSSRGRAVTLGSDGKFEARISFYGETRLIDSYETSLEAQIAIIFAQTVFERIKEQKEFDDVSEVEKKCGDIINNIREATSASFDRAIEEEFEEEPPVGVTLGSDGQYAAWISFHGETRLIGLYETERTAQIAFDYAKSEVDLFEQHMQGFYEIEPTYKDILEMGRRAARKDIAVHAGIENRDKNITLSVSGI